MSLDTFKQRLAYIHTGLNGAWPESMCSGVVLGQVFILPLLQAAGFDIYNPLEVTPLHHHFGVRHSSFVFSLPDDTQQYKPLACIILDSSANSKNSFDTYENFAMQNDIRWIIITNTKQWFLFDRQGKNEEIVKLDVLQTDTSDTEELFEFLSAENWRGMVDITEIVQMHRENKERKQYLEQLIREKKLSLNISREQAIENIQQTERLSYKDLAILNVGQPELTLFKKIEEGQDLPVSPEIKQLVEILRKKAHHFPNTQRTSEIKLAGYRLVSGNWTNFHSILAQYAHENNLHLAIVSEERAKRNNKVRYVKLDQDVYYSVHYCADTHQNKIRNILMQMNMPQGMVEIAYRGTSVILP